ncbi:hypothetical protein [Halobaculum sp. MBLA0143]|uniref:hypothetical protein n=1 Tax=Halobaculum sp. MBLA0143 TaxID=3079933 RepID=UPI0035260099
MVQERLDDGVRIAQLLSSELSSEAVRPTFAVVDADPDVEPTPDGATAYRVVLDGESGSVPVASVAVHPDRAHAAVTATDATAADLPAVAADAAREAGLRVRPKAVTPPQTLVFVEDGADVKRVLPVFAAVADALGGGEPADDGDGEAAGDGGGGPAEGGERGATDDGE